MATRTDGTGFKLDARPDRVDLRDREYQPRLVSLPSQFPDKAFIREHFPTYGRLVLNQGYEGACTGFGLAAVVNYLLWKRALDGGPWHDESVSPRMLYHLARLYDEWPGEDYEGSSCRGAMKGWHRHGVCRLSLWESGGLADTGKPAKKSKKATARTASFKAPKDSSWQDDAATRPLGAYYRIAKDSIVDMQSAIAEVGAIFCSADTHAGWDKPEISAKSIDLPMINLVEKNDGGHAFAIVGYTAEGFIVQNSWGKDWGRSGFALLGYDDWVKNGMDAWVAVLGAPVASGKSRRTRLSDDLSDRASSRFSVAVPARSGVGARVGQPPYDESQAKMHSVFLGNDGRPLNYIVDVKDAAAAVEEVVYRLPKTSFGGRKGAKLAIYAHGGLNSESDGIERTQVMAPYFETNGIYPVFINWRTGFWESLKNIGSDVWGGVFGKSERAEGWRDWLKEKADAVGDKVKEARDRSLEAIFEKVLVKAVWAQMKQNAEAAGQGSGGLRLIAAALAKLAAESKGLEVHLVGHSAGSILHGHLLECFSEFGVKAESVHLYAPACTVAFANKKYGDAMAKKTMSADTFRVDVLSEKREREDSVGPYGKSLLYLVSRALETVHKMPLLGMEAAWDESKAPQDVWNNDCLGDIQAWKKRMANRPGVLRPLNDAKIFDGLNWIPSAHGSFDNDVAIVARTLSLISGTIVAPKSLCLAGF